MSREQRERIKAELGWPGVAASSDRSIVQIRADFARFMATMRVPAGTRNHRRRWGRAAHCWSKPSAGRGRVRSSIFMAVPA